jgi:MFS family permease
LTQEPRRRLNVLSKDLFLSLYLPAFALALGEGMMAPVLPIYAKSFEVSFEVATLVIIIQGVGGLVATFPTGMLVDRIGRRPVLLAGPIITAASSFLTALAPSFAFLLACRFFAGGASQMWQLSRLAMIADTGADRERGRLITWMMEMSRIAGLISPVVGGFTAALWDIRIPFVLHGILVLVAIIPSFRITKETDPNRGPGRTAPEPIPGGPWRYVLSQMRQPQIAAFMLAQFLATFCRGLNRGGLLNLYAAYTYGVGPATLGVLASANSFIGLPIGFSTGYIMDRWGRKRTIVPGFSLLFIALLFMASTALFQMPFEILRGGVLRSASLAGDHRGQHAGDGVRLGAEAGAGPVHLGVAADREPGIRGERAFVRSDRRGVRLCSFDGHHGVRVAGGCTGGGASYPGNRGPGS